jgi:Putative Flp pilus-assembly TadE/G-like
VRSRKPRVRLNDERGVVAVVVALLMVVLGGSAAMTFDLSRLRHERHLIQAAVDLGSLAGAAYMPVSSPATAAQAEAVALEVASANAGQLSSGNVSISFLCVVSDPEGNGGADSDELRYRCGHPDVDWGDGLWTSRNGKASHPCNPYAGDVCNTIKLTASSTIDFYFAPLLGFNSGSTGGVQAASCRGCGPAPLDMVIVVDRTGSMSTTDVANVRNAIANSDGALNSVLEFYDPTNVRIGLVAVPYRNTTNCNVGVADPQFYPATNPATWQVVPISGGYRLSSGNLNPSSTLVQRVQCLQRAGSPDIIVDGRDSDGNHTNYGDPIAAAQWMLENQGRPGIPNAIVFMGDGEANQPQAYDSGGRRIAGRYNPCAYAATAASAAKTRVASGIDPTTVFSLGYGVDSGIRCVRDSSPSPFAGAYATTFFAAVASHLLDGTPSTDDGTASNDNQPGGCSPAENTDGDYYFCEERGENLSTVFLQIAAATQQHSQLVNF